jgi:hypothetical protein
VSGAAGLPSMPGRWQRRRSHQHQYPLQPVRTPGAAAAATAIMGPAGPDMPAGTSPMGPVLNPAAGQPAGTPAFIPGKGWATIIWSQPPQPGAHILGQPGGWPGPGLQTGAAGPEPGPFVGQPAMSQGPRLPGSSMPSTGSGSGSNLNPLSPPTPAELAGAGASWSSSSSGGGGSGGGGWGAWGGRRNGPGLPDQVLPVQPGDSDDDWEVDVSTDDADEDTDGTPVWPWPGSPLARSNSPDPTPATGARASPSPSSSSSMWSPQRPSPSPAARWTPPSGPTVVTGPSKTDPDRPWLSGALGASPSPNPRPGAAVIQPGAIGAARSPSPSPKPSAEAVTGPGAAAGVRSSSAPTGSSSGSGMQPGSDSDEWDEGEGDGITGVLMPRSSPLVTAPVGGFGVGPGGSRPSPSPSPSSSLRPAGSQPAAAGAGSALEDADMAPPGVVADVDLEDADISTDDAGLVDVTGVEDSLSTATSTGSSRPAGPVQGGLVVRPGSGGGSSGPGMGVPGPGATRATNATGSGPGASMGPRMGPGGAVPESGPRASSNASSTAAQAGFTLGPSLPTKPGATASSTGSRPVIPTAAPDSSLAQGPKSFLWESKGATRTILIGCAVPFEGSDQAVVGKAVHAAFKMALQELGPTLKLPVNVNLTCLNTKV